jgi:hypothetical protein
MFLDNKICLNLNKTDRHIRTEIFMKCTSATQFEINPMTNRTDQSVLLVEETGKIANMTVTDHNCFER